MSRLPALFFQLLAKTPIERLTEWSYHLRLGVFDLSSFSPSCSSGSVLLLARRDRRSRRSRGWPPPTAISAIWAGTGAACLRRGGGGAGGADLLLRKHHAFRHRADDDGAVGRREGISPAQLALGVVRKIVLHPFIIATAAGVARRLSRVPAAAAGRAPARISGAGRRTLRAVCHGRDAGAAAAQPRAARTRPDRGAEAHRPPAALLRRAELGRQFFGIWLFSAVLLAALPTATNVFVIAQQYGVWVQRASASILLTTCFRSAPSPGCST